MQQLGEDTRVERAPAMAGSPAPGPARRRRDWRWWAMRLLPLGLLGVVIVWVISLVNVAGQEALLPPPTREAQFAAGDRVVEALGGLAAGRPLPADLALAPGVEQELRGLLVSGRYSLRPGRVVGLEVRPVRWERTQLLRPYPGPGYYPLEEGVSLVGLLEGTMQVARPGRGGESVAGETLSARFGVHLVREGDVWTVIGVRAEPLVP